ncbi:MAG: exodeoxyribonuclease VII small subunit [bacterium]|nr:exodeoxyribonuclease VII small subunit [bacterium]
MSGQSRKYEENYTVLEKITESLNKDEVGIDDLVEKTREALNAARACMEILNQQKGEFNKLETEFAQLLNAPAEVTAPAVEVTGPPSAPPPTAADFQGEDPNDPHGIGADDPF